MSELTRRSFMSHTAQSCFGLTIGGSAAYMFSKQAFAASSPEVIQAGGGKAKSIIYIFISGGLTHIDTFDPKPHADSEIKGNVSAISTNVDGIQLGEHLPLLAQQMDKISLIRSMNSTQGAHEQGRYFMRTGYTSRSNMTHPSMGSWINRLNPQTTSTLPNFVTVGCGNDHPGAGFFEPQYAPLPIGEASKGLENSRAPKGVTDAAFTRQLALRQSLDASFDAKYSTHSKSVRAYNDIFDSALKLMKSEDLKAFNIKDESIETHKLYGSEPFSKGLLLARRLVEHGVRAIEVEFNGFDWHDDIFSKADEKLPVLDQALAALIQDLDNKGLLDSTLVVLGTEFGRNPQINQNSGRDHFPKAFSTLMAGGGIKGGFIHGATDAEAKNVTKDKVTAADFNATIAHAMGLPGDTELISPSKRPFKMSGKKGSAIKDLFA